MSRGRALLSAALAAPHRGNQQQQSGLDDIRTRFEAIQSDSTISPPPDATTESLPVIRLLRGLCGRVQRRLAVRVGKMGRKLTSEAAGAFVKTFAAIAEHDSGLRDLDRDVGIGLVPFSKMSGLLPAGFVAVDLRGLPAAVLGDSATESLVYLRDARAVDARGLCVNAGSVAVLEKLCVSASHLCALRLDGDGRLDVSCASLLGGLIGRGSLRVVELGRVGSLLRTVLELGRGVFSGGERREVLVLLDDAHVQWLERIGSGAYRWKGEEEEEVKELAEEVLRLVGEEVGEKEGVKELVRRAVKMCEGFVTGDRMEFEDAYFEVVRRAVERTRGACLGKGPWTKAGEVAVSWSRRACGHEGMEALTEQLERIAREDVQIILPDTPSKTDQPQQQQQQQQHLHPTSPPKDTPLQPVPISEPPQTVTKPTSTLAISVDRSKPSSSSSSFSPIQDTSSPPPQQAGLASSILARHRKRPRPKHYIRNDDDDPSDDHSAPPFTPQLPKQTSLSPPKPLKLDFSNDQHSPKPPTSHPEPKRRRTTTTTTTSTTEPQPSEDDRDTDEVDHDFASIPLPQHPKPPTTSSSTIPQPHKPHKPIQTSKLPASKPQHSSHRGALMRRIHAVSAGLARLSAVPPRKFPTSSSSSKPNQLPPFQATLLRRYQFLRPQLVDLMDLVDRNADPRSADAYDKLYRTYINLKTQLERLGVLEKE